MACGHRVHLLRNSGHWVRGNRSRMEGVSPRIESPWGIRVQTLGLSGSYACGAVRGIVVPRGLRLTTSHLPRHRCTQTSQCSYLTSCPPRLGLWICINGEQQHSGNKSNLPGNKSNLPGRPTFIRADMS